MMHTVTFYLVHVLYISKSLPHGDLLAPELQAGVGRVERTQPKHLFQCIIVLISVLAIEFVQIYA